MCYLGDNGGAARGRWSGWRGVYGWLGGWVAVGGSASVVGGSEGERKRGGGQAVGIRIIRTEEVKAEAMEACSECCGCGSGCGGCGGCVGDEDGRRGGGGR